MLGEILLKFYPACAENVDPFCEGHPVSNLPLGVRGHCLVRQGIHCGPFVGRAKRGSAGDCLVSKPGYDVLGTGLQGAGLVELVSGLDGLPIIAITGRACKAFLGSAFAGHVDIDWGGFLDVVVGAPGIRNGLKLPA